MFSGLIFMHLQNKVARVHADVVGAAMIVGFLYAWLLSPLEDRH